MYLSPDHRHLYRQLIPIKSRHDPTNIALIPDNQTQLHNQPTTTEHGKPTGSVFKARARATIRSRASGWGIRTIHLIAPLPIFDC
jgi:hypothetical protein